MAETNPVVKSLSESLIIELNKALALPDTTSIRQLIRLIFGKAARRFSELMVNMERVLSQNGPAAAARWVLPYFVKNYSAMGQENIPTDGSVLIVSNHPAAYDAMAITAYVPRRDYKIIIGELPCYHYLPSLCQHAIFAPPVSNTHGRMSAFRQAIRHLRQGGALLIFPRGNIEPDPDAMPDAAPEFDEWSRSIELFLTAIPELRVLFTMVSGVISPQAMQHPLTWFRKGRRDRQRIAFMYQMVRQALSGQETFGLHAKITFGEIFTSSRLSRSIEEFEARARQTYALHRTLFPPKVNDPARSS